jgi:hypothetical protein
MGSKNHFESKRRYFFLYSWIRNVKTFLVVRVCEIIGMFCVDCLRVMGIFTNAKWALRISKQGGLFVRVRM